LLRIHSSAHDNYPKNRQWLSSLCLGVVVSIALKIVACTHQDVPEYVHIELEEAISEEVPPSGVSAEVVAPTVPKSSLESLEAFMDEHPNAAQYLADVYQVLLARELENAGKWSDALKAWRQAAETSEGRIAKLAFEGWLRAFRKFESRDKRS
jgi:hypothetical protein